MNKEEILLKAQSKKKNKPDEMETQVTQKGGVIALVCILLASFILMIVKIIAGQPWYDVYSLCFISMGVQNLYKGIKLHKKNELLQGISAIAISLLFLISYIIDIL